MTQHSRRAQGEQRHEWRTPDQRPDDQLTEEIADRLGDDDSVDPSGITIHVDTGVVTLTGLVNSEAQKGAAETCARGVAGVNDVINELRVRGGETSDQVG